VVLMRKVALSWSGPVADVSDLLDDGTHDFVPGDVSVQLVSATVGDPSEIFPPSKFRCFPLLLMYDSCLFFSLLR